MRRALAAILLAVFGAGVLAAGAPALGPNEGVVRGVDVLAREITIRHGPLPEIDMPAMTMVFGVGDAALLRDVAAGDRVRFRADIIGGKILVTKIALAAAGDVRRGARLFGQCVACHSIKPGEHLTGPSLAHVWNHKSGSAEGFLRYSDAIKRADLPWNASTLDKWLADPGHFLPGTSMTFPGIKESQARQDVIAFLQAVDEGKLPQTQGRRGTGMNKADMRSAPPQGQVTSIKYCGDTYTVDTADGSSQKVWEFNLRFKSDSSKLGPAPGKPVVVGAGMQGDRASVVFASPKEISAFVKPACP